MVGLFVIIIVVSTVIGFGTPCLCIRDLGRIIRLATPCYYNIINLLLLFLIANRRRAQSHH